VAKVMRAPAQRQAAREPPRMRQPQAGSKGGNPAQPERSFNSAQHFHRRAAADGDLASGHGWHKLEGEGQAKSAAALALRP